MLIRIFADFGWLVAIVILLVADRQLPAWFHIVLIAAAALSIIATARALVQKLRR
ncbi:hypothetical protein [Effusibacillus pohliae]|uniref:hypothetical protein n=1 Tax=Effusibacillus pohliae TaxID=232270 RepID=UPI00037EEC3F|nr:hypothetical protein [Effusibacillus pohliae]